MKKTLTVLLSGLLFCGCCSQKRVSTTSPAFCQINTNDVAKLTGRVDQLEKQVQEITQRLNQANAQSTPNNRQNALRARFLQRIALDRNNYTEQQLDEAEQLYQVANKKFGAPEAVESLKTMIGKYPNLNRTGCAVLYVAQMSKGEDRAKGLQDCIDKYNDCIYGDGVQVGVYARFLLAQDYKNQGETEKAKALFGEIISKYSDAIDHRGSLLVNSIER